MFKSLRWRLQAWHTLILLLVVAGFGGMLYAEASQAAVRRDRRRASGRRAGARRRPPNVPGRRPPSAASDRPATQASPPGRFRRRARVHSPDRRRAAAQPPDDPGPPGMRLMPMRTRRRSSPAHSACRIRSWIDTPIRETSPTSWCATPTASVLRADPPEIRRTGTARPDRRSLVRIALAQPRHAPRGDVARPGPDDDPRRTADPPRAGRPAADGVAARLTGLGVFLGRPGRGLVAVVARRAADRRDERDGLRNQCQQPVATARPRRRRYRARQSGHTRSTPCSNGSRARLSSRCGSRPTRRTSCERRWP